MSDFSVNFGEIWAYVKNEATGENEEGVISPTQVVQFDC